MHFFSEFVKMLALIICTVPSLFAAGYLRMVSKNSNMSELSGFLFHLLKSKIMKTPWRKVTGRDHKIFPPRLLSVYEDSCKHFTLHTLYNKRHQSGHYFLYISLRYSQVRCTRWCSWLRPCGTSRKVAGSTPDCDIGIFHWHNPSGRTMVLGLTHPVTEMNTRNISWEQRRPVRGADNLTTFMCRLSWNLGASTFVQLPVKICKNL